MRNTLVSQMIATMILIDGLNINPGKHSLNGNVILSDLSGGGDPSSSSMRNNNSGCNSRFTSCGGIQCKSRDLEPMRPSPLFEFHATYQYYAIN